MAFEYGKTDRDKVRNESTGDTAVREFLPKKGVSQVRILPPHPESDIWYEKVHCHYVDGAGYVPCPRGFGEACPICEVGESLYESGDESSVEKALDLRPREQYYYNVVVFSSEAYQNVGPRDGVRVMRTGVKVFRQLKDLDNDESGGWGNMTDPEKGFDVRISRKGEGRTDTEYIAKGVPNKVPLKDSLEQHDVDINSLTLFNLKDHVQTLTLGYEDLKLRFENKQVAPGFPGGPRRSVENLSVPSKVSIPSDSPEEGATTDVVGDFTPPPEIN